MKKFKILWGFAPSGQGTAPSRSHPIHLEDNQAVQVERQNGSSDTI